MLAKEDNFSLHPSGDHLESISARGCTGECNIEMSVFFAVVLSLYILPLGKLSVLKVRQHWRESTLEVHFPVPEKKVQLDLRKY